MSGRPKFMSDLSASERRVVAAMDDLGFGRFENLRITRGELLLDPWPTAVRVVRFGSQSDATRITSLGDFELNSQLADLFEYVRAVEVGEILCLELRYGSPVVMEVEHRPTEAQ